MAEGQIENNGSVWECLYVLWHRKVLLRLQMTSVIKQKAARKLFFQLATSYRT